MNAIKVTTVVKLAVHHASRLSVANLDVAMGARPPAVSVLNVVGILMAGLPD
jgi:hypothetical protein